MQLAVRVGRTGTDTYLQAINIGAKLLPLRLEYTGTELMSTTVYMTFVKGTMLIFIIADIIIALLGT